MQREAIIKDQTCGKGVERVLKKRQNMDVALLWSLKRFGILELRDSTSIFTQYKAAHSTHPPSSKKIQRP